MSLSADAAPAGATKLTETAIVATAIAMADADGISGLSMRRIADELGVGVMSLYRHIDDKDALIQAMSEEVGRRFPYPADDSMPWRERVRVAVDIDWALYRRHPWVVLAYSSPRYSFGPESLRCLDWLSAGFLELDVEITRAVDMALAVWGHVHGFALVAVSDSVLGPADNDDRPHPDALADLIEGRGRSADRRSQNTDGRSQNTDGRSQNTDGRSQNADERRQDTDTPHLNLLADHPEAGRLLDLRERVDAGVEYLCAGFEAVARG